MPDDQNTTQNPTPTENSIPPSPQEPTADAPIPTTVSTPAEVPPGATEASGAGFSAESTNIASPNSASLGGFGEAKTEETQAQNGPDIESISEPVEVPEPSADTEAEADKEMAQMGRNEPLPAEGEAKGESSRTQTQTSKNPVRVILAKAQQAIQNKKRKKLDSILTLFAKRTNITNDEVEKFLHVSDATTTRYLSQLEKQGKIKQNGKTGRSVSYLKI